MLHNIQILCPSLAIFASNCYTQQIRLLVVGGAELQSVEGTTQGDPIAMALYGICITPLLTALKSLTNDVKHAAFADDLTGAGRLESLRQWWENLIQLGPKIGYFPNPQKSWLIVKEQHSDLVKAFEDTSIKITYDGQRHLGAVIGDAKFKEEYISEKVRIWVEELNLLSKIAKSQPQAAYVAFIIGFKNKFNYVLRTMADIGQLLLPVENQIRFHLIPSLCNGRNCNDNERILLSLPIKMGGLGIINITEEAANQFQTSKAVTSQLCSLIVNQSDEKVESASSHNILNRRKNIQKSSNEEKLREVLQKLPSIQKKAIEMDCKE